MVYCKYAHYIRVAKLCVVLIQIKAAEPDVLYFYRSTNKCIPVDRKCSNWVFYFQPKALKITNQSIKFSPWGSFKENIMSGWDNGLTPLQVHARFIIAPFCFVSFVYG
ncbi:hypothetical protein EAH73_00260 [Hymenobacter nivis]|uniref:Uncharacterized protein n=1 Tax=Hymenobacter nivis TaxID=1850093 RepID=A0A502HAQ0_9BACT|nr:hypothetical protein EAH73_00260 [Hymenobacter nivis]